MNKILKYIVILISCAAFFMTNSCDRLKKVDSTIRKAFGQVNRFERQKKLYSKRLGLDKKEKGGSEKTVQYNPIQQKNIINKYGYLFESINGINPGRIKSYNAQDSVGNIFIIDNPKFKGIKSENEVFGWHPYWMGSKWENYPFELLSTISYFSYKVDPASGLCQNPEQLKGWTNSDFVAKAKAKNTRVLLTVSCHGNSKNDFLDNKALWSTLFKDVSTLVLSKDADGIDINFENLPSGKREDFVNFVQQFRSQLDLDFENQKKKRPFISVTLPASYDKEHFDIRKLDSYVDLFVIMGYDYNDKNSPGAVSPLQAGKNENSLNTTVDFYIERGINKEKTVLALPYYGIMWDVSKEGNSLKAKLERKLTYSEINNFFLKDTINKTSVVIDQTSMTNIFSIIFEDNSLKEIYYDDAYTLSKKYNLAMYKGLKGIGVWALGYDDGYTELWDLIEADFATNQRVIKDPIAEVNGFSINFAKKIVQNKDIFIAIIIYFLLALVTAFIILLSDWRVRDSIIKSRVNQLIVVFLGFVLLIPTVAFLNELTYKLGWQVKAEWEIFVAFFVGILVFYLGTKIQFGNFKEKP